MGKIPEDPRSSEKECLGDQLEALVEVQEQADEGLNIGSDREDSDFCLPDQEFMMHVYAKEVIQSWDRL